MAKVITHTFQATPEWIAFLQEKEGIDWERGFRKHGEVITIDCTSQQLVDLSIEFSNYQNWKGE